MKYIFLTLTFKKRLLKFKKHFTKKDLLYDLKDFIINGLRKDGTYLKKSPKFLYIQIPLRLLDE
ncbi:MAG: hypothetical protein COB02_11705 [Candidatus Cloacimonadota bacterium]|nr:MAG: hypothetical protein COB02_11705 [Candidatus Cloacimonadota bacterium]